MTKAKGKASRRRTHSADQQMNSAEPGREIVVGVLADPGFPTAIADPLASQLAAALPTHVAGEAISWRVSVVCDPFEALEPDYERLLDKARQRVHATDWDLAVCLTDTPLREAGSVVVAELGAKDPIAVVSLPAVGGIALGRRTRRLVAILATHLAADIVTPDRARAVLRDDPHLRGDRSLRVVESEAEDISADVVVVRPFGLLRLVAGMVRSNRPWRLVWGLSAALGGATAGAAFGVFYSNIWSLADSLPPARLLAVVAGAVAVHTVWLVLGHGLWEPPNRSTRPDRASTALRNLGTALTILFGTVVFTAALFVLTLAAALLVITPDYLGSVLGHPADITDYLGVALMGTVMGTIAGAVGSGLEDDTTVREATYGHRARQRARWE